MVGKLEELRRGLNLLQEIEEDLSRQGMEFSPEEDSSSKDSFHLSQSVGRDGLQLSMYLLISPSAPDEWGNAQFTHGEVGLRLLFPKRQVSIKVFDSRPAETREVEPCLTVFYSLKGKEWGTLSLYFTEIPNGLSQWFTPGLTETTVEGVRNLSAEEAMKAMRALTQHFLNR